MLKMNVMHVLDACNNFNTCGAGVIVNRKSPTSSVVGAIVVWEP